MGQRNKQHMGRSTDQGHDLVGRDVRAGDELAERATSNTVPMPNEEGTDFSADQPVDTGMRPAPAHDEMRRKDLKHGGSGSRETSG
ncbi:MAG TPA: hypothetical protein VGE02_01440 [Gemmatimonadales bacterium]